MGVLVLHSDLEGGFPTKVISPNTELREGKGVGSSTVTVPETFEMIPSDMPVTHMFPGGALEPERGERGPWRPQ